MVRHHNDHDRKKMWACLLALLTSCVTIDKSKSLGVSQCSDSIQQILTNGVFNTLEPRSVENAFIAGSLAMQSYPHHWKNISFDTTVQGLSDEQNSSFQNQFRKRWQTLGATDVTFIDSGNSAHQRLGLDAHAIIITSVDDIFLIVRGTPKLNQVFSKIDTATVTTKIFGQNIILWAPVVKSLANIYQQIDETLITAVNTLKNSSANKQHPPPKIWVTGHGLGGGLATLLSLKLLDHHRDLKFAGIYTFGSPMIGVTCALNEQCWTKLYSEKLGKITFRWVNNHDLMPFWPQAQIPYQHWGHVPGPHYAMYRILGEECDPVSGLNSANCPPEMSELNASQNCPTSSRDHIPWSYVRKIGGCTLKHLEQANKVLVNKNTSQRNSCIATTLRVSMLGERR